MKTLKRSLHLLLVLALTLSMALMSVSCGGEEEQPSDDTNKPADPTVTGIEAIINVAELPAGSKVESYAHMISVMQVYSDSTADKPHKEAVTDFTVETKGVITAGDNKITVKSGSFTTTVSYKGVDASAAELFEFDAATGTITGFVPFNKVELTDEDGDTYMGYPSAEYPTTLVIPSEIGGVKVVAIGNKAFSPEDEITEFTKVLLPDTITTIDSLAFAYASKVVKDEDAPDTGFDRFKAAGGLDSIAIPSTVTELGEKAFMECGSLVNIVLPETITAIRDRTFDACYSLKTFTVPKSVKTLGNYAFRKCYNLVSFTLSAGIDTIGRETFHYCEALEELVIPEGVKTIGEEAFLDCSKLMKITFPSTLEVVGKDAFNQTCKWRYNQPKNSPVYAGNVLIGYNYETKVVKDERTGLDVEVDIIPESLVIEAKEGTVAIGESAFVGADHITAVTLPSTVKYIGQRAFDGCSGLTAIALPKDVTLGALAFRNCSKLANITIPDALGEIGENALQNTAWLSAQPAGVVYLGNYAYAFISGEGNSTADITLRDGTTSFADTLFAGQKGLNSVVIPDSIKTIPAGAFASCTALVSITLGNGVESIGDSAFANCSALKTVNFGTGLKTIGTKAFYNLPQLLTTKLPEGLTTIGSEAFGACIRLADVTIPASVTAIGDNAYLDCVTLQVKGVTVTAGSFAETYMKANGFKCKNA